MAATSIKSFVKDSLERSLAILNNRINALDNFSTEVVAELPTENISSSTIYLLKKQDDVNNIYEEYIYINNSWELLGTAKIDLSNYFTKVEVQDEIIDAIAAIDLSPYALKVNYYTKTETDAKYIPVEDAPVQATEDTLGLVKLNSSQSINVDENGKLTVGGRLGQMSNSTGIYSPVNINPYDVGNGSFLITEASNTRLGTKSLSVTTGFNLTLNGSHAAGSTSYKVSGSSLSNKILMAITKNAGGVMCLNENDAANCVRIVRILQGGADFASNSWNNSSTSDFQIDVESSINPDSAINTIRIYPNQFGFSNILFGAAGTKQGFGYSVVGGQQVYNGANASGVFGFCNVNEGNSSLLAGREHYNNYFDCFVCGRGNFTTQRYQTVMGYYADTSTKPLFAVGNGTEKSRKNAFEVSNTGVATATGVATENLYLYSPNRTRYKITVDNSGNLTTTVV